jgi:hypothetical protein
LMMRMPRLQPVSDILVKNLHAGQQHVESWSDGVGG